MAIATSPDDILELRRRLEEAEETLRAIRCGEVDALIVEDTDGERVCVLQGADHPYRSLIEAMQQGAVSLSGDGTILYCNRSFAEMVRMSDEKVIGSAISQFVSSSHSEFLGTLLQQARTIKCQGELQFKSADGALIPIYIALAPLSLDNAVAMCMVVTDLRPQKRLEDENRRKDEFLAMLAHELRNPLAPIQNSVAILGQLDVRDENLAVAQEIIQRQVHHMSHLVDDLLDVSRITMGKVTLHKQAIDLATILRRAVETTRPLIDARKHRLTLCLPPKDVRVLADPTRLTQVIGNLLTNAAKYTDEHGEILLTTERNDGEVAIQCRDNGMGISSELLPQVFDPFIQGDRSLARSEGGLGIGLTLVRRLVELHDGTVEVSSDGPGKGSEFVVRLQTLEEIQQPTERQLDRFGNATDGVHLRILIVEDNKDGADSLGLLLTMLGHQVRISYTGTEALPMAKSLLPQVILLDIGLPGLTGYDVARQLRKRLEFDSTVLIAMSGYGQDEDKQRSREAGFNHHLVKPVDPDLLSALLHSINGNTTWSS